MKSDREDGGGGFRGHAGVPEGEEQNRESREPRDEDLALSSPSRERGEREGQ